jgi:hypothetical protein
MSKKVFKHLKVTQNCKKCNSDFIRNIIVVINKDLKTSDLTKVVFNHPEIVKTCLQCKASDFNIKYSFYHEEKITAND